jgi:hypothetical protein
VRTKLALLVLILWTALASAQVSADRQDRLIIGGHAGIFRISYNNFDDLYDGRSGLTPGVSAMVRIYAPYYAMLKFHHFEKEAEVVANGSSLPQRWKENWFNIGMRYHAYNERRVTNYFGFGFAIFRINEAGPASLFGGQPRKRDASGFFLDGGLEYRFTNYASFYFELEVTSAGIEGKSGFEGSSVGGFWVGVGVNVFVL